MYRRHSFERLLVSLHDAALDDDLWPATSRLVDEVCGATGNFVIVSQGVGGDARPLFVRNYHRGHRRHDLERDYLDNYFHRKPGILRRADLAHLVLSVPARKVPALPLSTFGRVEPPWAVLNAPTAHP